MTEIHRTVDADGRVTVTEVTTVKKHGLIWNVIKLVFWGWLLVILIGALLS